MVVAECFVLVGISSQLGSDKLFITFIIYWVVILWSYMQYMYENVYDLKNNLCWMNEPQKPLNPETETFMHAWLCKLYLLSGSEGCKVPSLKNGFL